MPSNYLVLVLDALHFGNFTYKSLNLFSLAIDNYVNIWIINLFVGPPTSDRRRFPDHQRFSMKR